MLNKIWKLNIKVKALLIVLILIAGFLFYKSKQTQPISYSTSTVEKGTVVSTVTGSGKIISANIINVNTTSTGVIKKTYVKDGDKVKKGQKLAEIELDESGRQKYLSSYSSYLSAKNSVDSSNTNLYTLQSAMFAANQKFINDAVARNLDSTDPTYIQEYSDWKAAESKYQSQTNAINQSKSALSASYSSYLLSSSTIYAPGDGVIKNVLVEGFPLLSTSTTFASIQSTGNPIMTIDLTEIDVPKVKVGLKATITIDSLSEKTFTGTVIQVNSLGTTTSNVTTYTTFIKLDNPSDIILPAMQGNANIIIEAKSDTLFVPSAALSSLNNTNTVRVKSGENIKTVEVEKGIVGDGVTEIISGLKEGDTVITGSVNQSSTQNSGSSPFSGAIRGNTFGGGNSVRITR